uniref:N-acetylglucosaminyl deacetylase, LmbE family n=1 Tax=Candidatus Kentrum sp. MB TaxID=2138164 RepID=A0A450XEU3_9GAMM|nr:MAG: N-acetylglucosaminyl deacetylase, LmbE family [Candidatus Kentron sp. MB]VFK30230.1 MAG: N-acetylglucosaminyl deacetylase, LmbE family [Candidatus Kentron sp. MB]VFK75144.1 MAG: N-acetylglucosaminyl deacetylase, LmbE family [Candidatus Kentron sp. MB]
MRETSSYPNRALVLVAHADDESLGAGGLIRKLKKANWEIPVVIVSDGIIRVRGKIQDNRNDARRACGILGVEDPIFLGYEDQKFDQYPIAEIANSVASLDCQPDLIITHAQTDLNRDHRLVLEIAKIMGRPLNKPISILGCEIPNASFWNGKPFPANYYVDITEELKTKIQAFSQYKNELNSYPHPWSEKGLTLLAEYHGMQSGYQYAEAYRLIRGYATTLLR